MLALKLISKAQQGVKYALICCPQSTKTTSLLRARTLVTRFGFLPIFVQISWLSYISISITDWPLFPSTLTLPSRNPNKRLWFYLLFFPAPFVLCFIHLCLTWRCGSCQCTVTAVYYNQAKVQRQVSIWRSDFHSAPSGRVFFFPSSLRSLASVTTAPSSSW